MEKIKITVSESLGSVSALVSAPRKMSALLVLAHGAGAGMEHTFMEQLAETLAERAIGTLRYNFPYMEHGKKRPDVPAVATQTVEAALAKASALFPKARIFAAGKSFGGRMTSHYLAKNKPGFVEGVIFYGFPLHAAGAPGVDRAGHLKTVELPMLFLQGSRDALADLTLIKQVSKKLKNSTLHVFDGADHSFKSGKRIFIPELADATQHWIDQLRA